MGSSNPPGSDRTVRGFRPVALGNKGKLARRLRVSAEVSSALCSSNQPSNSSATTCMSAVSAADRRSSESSALSLGQIPKINGLVSVSHTLSTTSRLGRTN